jgi:putative ABC transport system permease protein
MNALGRVVRAGVGRRRVQTVVMVLTTLISVAASVLAVGLLVASEAPFDHAFARQRGAHLTAQFSGATATQLAATKQTSGVTATAGPFQTVTAAPETNSGPVPGARLSELIIAGRAHNDGPVDDVTIVAGHWPTGAGQIVLSTQDEPVQLGSTLTFPDLPGKPTLTVVGRAQSVTDTADAWVTPDQAGTMSTARTYEMLYRFDHAATKGQLGDDRNAIAAAVPHGAMTGTESWLTAKQHSDENAKAYVPFVAAFGALGLALSVLIIVIVVSGAVSSATRRIGILKSLGFTPAQVARAYMAQALIPAVLGAGLGVLIGNLLAVPALHDIEVGYGSASASIPPWVDIAVPAGVLGLVAVAALAPALRAGRLRTADAIAIGRSPNATRGRLVRRATGRLPLSRPVSLGLANPFARPARSATMTAAVAMAAVTVTLGVGLTLSLNAVEKGRELDSSGSVVVQTGGMKPGPEATKPADPARISAAINAHPGTRAFYGTARTQLDVSGIAGPTPVVAYTGDSSWATHQMVSGHWLTGPGQAVVTSRTLDAADVKVGDTVTLTYHGKRTTVRIVGEAFFLSDEAMDLLTDNSSLAPLGLHLKPDQFNVDLKPGTGLAGYVNSLNTTLRPIGADAEVNSADSSTVIATMDALIGMLTLMLVAAAALGVLNTVVLETRERVHDLGVFKALGMAPRQTVAMVLTSVAGLGLIAGAIGVPIGVAVHDLVIRLMGDSIDVHVAPAEVGVYAPLALVALGIGGLVIAMAGALVPAGWAARTRTATALRAE